MFLVAAAFVAWCVVAFVVAFASPEGHAGVQFLGALTMGTAVALTLWPLLWSATRNRESSLATSGRRSFLAGVVVSILVVLRAIDVVSAPIVLFLIVGAVLIEIGFTLRR